MSEHVLLKFKITIAVTVMAIMFFAQFAFSQVGYIIQDKDGFVNLRIKPNIKADVKLKIPNGECVIEGYRRGEWCRVMYFKEKEKRLYVGYVHASRIRRDATCEEIITRNNIGECEIKDLRFDYDGTFKTLFDWFNAEYLAKCDDASYAEGMSDFVVTRLASDWDTSVAELKKYSDKKNYMDFVLKHIDGSCDHGDLKKVMNLSSNCMVMVSEQSEMCKKIFDAAKSANADNCNPSSLSDKALNLVKPLIELRIKEYNDLYGEDDGPRRLAKSKYMPDVDRLFYSILKNHSAVGDEAVAYLLNVYMGEHLGEELVCEAINRGERMLSLIREYSRCTPLIGIEPLPDSVQGSGYLPQHAEQGILTGKKCSHE